MQVSSSVLPFVRPSVRLSTVTLGTLSAQLLLQFYTDLFETLQIFLHGTGMGVWFGYNC